MEANTAISALEIHQHLGRLGKAKLSTMWKNASLLTKIMSGTKIFTIKHHLSSSKRIIS